MFLVLYIGGDQEDGQGGTDDLDAYQWDDNLTIGVCFELDVGANAGTKSNVVVNFTVDGKDYFAVLANQRLGTSIF